MIAPGGFIPPKAGGMGKTRFSEAPRVPLGGLSTISVWLLGTAGTILPPPQIGEFSFFRSFDLGSLSNAYPTPFA
jgi:hypothetical protein